MFCLKLLYWLLVMRITFERFSFFFATRQPISGRVDRASATEMVDTGSIPGRVKSKTIKIGIHSFPA